MKVVILLIHSLLDFIQCGWYFWLGKLRSILIKFPAMKKIWSINFSNNYT